MRGDIVREGLEGFGEKENQVWVSMHEDGRWKHYWAESKDIGRGRDQTGQ